MKAAETTIIDVQAGRMVSGILHRPSADTLAALVLAHGAGAGMAHPFMAEVAGSLAARGIATLRFNFPFAEIGGKRPDPSPVARRAVRAAVEHAGRLLPGVPLFAGGKSFGGRMTSQAQAEMPLPNVRGLVFLGFPLHPAGKPSVERAAHLAQVEVPMLFVSGDRDALAEIDLLRTVVDPLRPLAKLAIVEDGDHSLHVRRSSGRTSTTALDQALDEMRVWIERQL